MKSLSFRLSEHLDAKLACVGRQRGESQAAVVWTAIKQYLNDPDNVPPGSLPECMGHLIGCVEGPGDLSTNPKYMERFGE